MHCLLSVVCTLAAAKVDVEWRHSGKDHRIRYTPTMLLGTHTIIYAKNADKARAFFRDVLGLRSVDAGRGWLIFALPPGEVACHPAGEGTASGTHTLYLMCKDIHKTVAALKKKGVKFTSEVADRGWGLLATMEAPGCGELSIYEPRHLTAIANPRRARGKRSSKRAASAK
jgi:catechol 2,3-dioxygenase-like lactoylglutathione lyase family enzyme